MATQTQIIKALEARVLKLVLKAMNRVATRFTRDVLAAGDPIDKNDLSRILQLWQDEVPDLAVDIAAIYASVGSQTAAKAGAILPSTLQVRYLEDATNRLNDVGNDLWHEATRALAEGVQQGEGYDALRQRLMDEFAKGGTQLGETRANRIARTEVQSAVNLGSFDAVKSINAEQRPVYKQWVATLDDRTRPDHADADGQVVPLDDPFLVGGDELMQPGDPNADLSQTINCRCVALFTSNPDGEDSDNRQFLSDEDTAAVLDKWSSEVGDMSDLQDELITAAYSEDQPRDDHGRFGQGGGDSAPKESSPLTGVSAQEACGVASLSTDQRAAFEDYQAASYEPINGILRQAGSDALVQVDPKLAETSSKMDQAFASAPATTADIQVSRGIDNATEIFGANATGTVFTDYGYVSTTTNASAGSMHARGDDAATIKIDVPSGSRAIALGDTNGFTNPAFQGENEILLPHDSSFKIMSDVHGPNGREIHAVLVPAQRTKAATERGATLAATGTANDKFVWQPGDVVVNSQLEDVTAADSGDHTGTGMIALVPSPADAARLVVPNGDTADELHVTLAFLGETDAMGDGSHQALQNLCTHLATLVAEPLEVEAWSANLFNPNGEEPCWTLGIGHHDQLENLHDATLRLVDTVSRQADGWTLAEQHKPWVPHLSLTYSSDTGLINTVMGKCGPLALDRLRLCIGDETWDYPLGATVAADQGDPMPETELAASDTVTPPAASFTTARIRGVTILDIPAFVEARIKTTGPIDENGMQPWAGPVTVEGTATGDGRIYEPDSFRWEDPDPGPLRWDIQDEGEHLGAVCVGRVYTLTRDAITGLINGTGVFDTNLTVGAVAAGATERGTIGWVSVDMDDIPEDSVNITDEQEPDMDPDDIPMVAIEAAVTANPDFPLADNDVDWDEAGAVARVLAYAAADDGTVNIPVVAGTYLWLPEGADPTDLSQYMLPFVDVFTDNTVAAVPNGLRAARENMLQLDQAAQDEITPVINGYLSAAVDTPDPSEGDDGAPPPASVIEASAWTQFKELPKLAANLFREPTPEELPTTDGPTHVNYANGRMFGWVAQRGVCHDGVTGSCLKPPLDNVDLSTFLRSKVELDDGSVITAGVFTMGTGHDNDGADVLATKALFDDTRTVAGIVTVGVNDRGMWFSGAAAPWLGDWDRRVFASCAPSGHWRRERSGQWSLRAVLSVPVPGFPTRLVASAVERANIAILTEPPTAEEQDDFLGQLKQDIPEVVLLASALVDEMEKRQRIRASIADLELVVSEARADIAASLLS